MDGRRARADADGAPKDGRDWGAHAMNFDEGGLMRAVVMHGFGDLRVDTVPDPRPGPGELLLDVACVQPSVTECMLIAGHDIPLHSQLAQRLSKEPVRFGGHEFAGVVRQVGAGVPGRCLGQRVTGIETITCGTCTACAHNRADACCRPEYLGFSRPGAFAERVVIPSSCAVPVPPRVSAGAVAAVQPLAGALHAHAAAEVRPGESMLIIGAGVMGLLALQVARRGNAGTVAVAGRSTNKLGLAERWGADFVLGADSDIVATTRDITEGIGFDVVVETAGGAPEAGLAGASMLEVAVRCARRGGRLIMVSVPPNRAETPMGLMRERALTLMHPRSGAGGYSAAGDVFTHALRLIARGDVDVEALITHEVEGLDALPRAIDMTLHKRAHGAINPVQVHLPTTWERQSGARPSPGPDVRASR